MLVTFSTDAYASITMFGDVADALNRLTAAIDASKSVPSAAEKTADEPSVSMATRALPLINLFTAATSEKAYVMWK